MAASGPVLQPVSPVNLILVEQIGQAFGQLIALAQISVVGQEALQRFEVRLIDQRRQQAHQAPGQRGLVEQGRLGDLVRTQHHAIQRPHETAGQLDVYGGSDTTATVIFILSIFGQGQLQPLCNAVALHQSNLVFQGRQWISPHPGHNQTAQLIRAVALNHHEACTQRGCNGHACFLDRCVEPDAEP